MSFGAYILVSSLAVVTGALQPLLVITKKARTMEKENICQSCRYCIAPTMKCNRLVFTAMGMRDKLGSDFKKGNQCPYHEDGEPQERDYKPLNFYNS